MSTDPLSPLATYLRELALEVLGPRASPSEVRAFVLGEATGGARVRHPEETPAQLRQRVVRCAGFVRARRIVAELVEDRLPANEDDAPYARLAGVPLLRALSSRPSREVTVTSWSGSGYSLVTDLLGPTVYAGTLPVEWTTPVLVVMGEHLTDAGVDMLRRLGVADPWPLVASLMIGEALVFQQPGEDVSRLALEGCAWCRAETHEWCEYDCGAPVPLLAPEYRTPGPIPVPPFTPRTEPPQE